MDGSLRYLAAGLIGLLLAPAVGMLAAPYETRSVIERRVLNPPPPWPASARQWFALPRAMDVWFADHFAWRGALVRAAFATQAKLGLRSAGSWQVVRGKGDWLLLYQGLLAATGGETSQTLAAAYGAFVCDVQRDARAHGAAFLFAPAPANVEIYPEAAPDWIPHGSPNQSDLVLQAASACGARTLDLRPAMRALRSSELLYQHHDSHWTNAGALAAFNGVARALGQPWAIDPRTLGWRAAKPFDSDLVRLAAAFDLPQELVPEPPEGPDLAPVAGRLNDIPHGAYPAPFLIPGRRPRPRVLLVGDSYAADFIEQYFRRAGVTLAWIHQADCRFDRRIFDRVHPDIVVLMPAARLEFCH